MGIGKKSNAFQTVRMDPTARIKVAYTLILIPMLIERKIIF